MFRYTIAVRRTTSGTGRGCAPDEVDGSLAVVTQPERFAFWAHHERRRASFGRQRAPRVESLRASEACSLLLSPRLLLPKPVAGGAVKRCSISSGSHRSTTHTVGYRHVKDFDTPGCRKSSRSYSQQYQSLPPDVRGRPVHLWKTPSRVCKQSRSTSDGGRRIQTNGSACSRRAGVSTDSKRNATTRGPRAA